MRRELDFSDWAPCVAYLAAIFFDASALCLPPDDLSFGNAVIAISMMMFGLLFVATLDNLLYTAWEGERWP